MRNLFLLLFLLSSTFLSSQSIFVDSVNFTVANIYSPTICVDDTIYLDVDQNGINDLFLYRRTGNSPCFERSFSLQTLGNTEFYTTRGCLAESVDKVRWGDSIQLSQSINNQLYSNFKGAFFEGHLYNEITLQGCGLFYCGGWFSGNDTSFFSVRLDTIRYFLVGFALQNANCFSLFGGNVNVNVNNSFENKSINGGLTIIRNQIHFDFDEKINVAQIISIDGKLLYEKEQIAKSEIIPIDFLKGGIYIVKAYNDKRSYSLKFIKP